MWKFPGGLSNEGEDFGKLFVERGKYIFEKKYHRKLNNVCMKLKIILLNLLVEIRGTTEYVT